MANSETTACTLKLNLGGEPAKALQDIATFMGLPVDQAIPRMIGDMLFIREHMAKGWRVCLERNGVYREVNWRE